MTLLDQTIAALFRKSSLISVGAEPPFAVDRRIIEAAPYEAAVAEYAGEDVNTTVVDDQPTEFSGKIKAEQISSPWAEIDLDTAIRLRWALRDIKGKRTKLTPISPSDLKALIEMGLVEIRNDAPLLTNEGHQALN
jgi:hypothetical protein